MFYTRYATGMVGAGGAKNYTMSLKGSKVLVKWRIYRG